jgi:hypothetical protein
MKKLKGKKYSMLSVISKYSFVFIFIFALMMPLVFVRGADPVSPTTGVSVSGIKNPLSSDMDTIPKFIEAIIHIVLIVGIPILVLAVIYAGFLYVKAQGNPSELEVAHRTLLYTVIGGALLLGAFVIANAIGQTVQEIGNGA